MLNPVKTLEGFEKNRSAQIQDLRKCASIQLATITAKIHASVFGKKINQNSYGSHFKFVLIFVCNVDLFILLHKHISSLLNYVISMKRPHSLPFLHSKIAVLAKSHFEFSTLGMAPLCTGQLFYICNLWLLVTLSHFIPK